MPKIILNELVEILKLEEFKKYFKGSWELQDDIILYKFDKKTNEELEKRHLREFMDDYIEFINQRLRCKIEIQTNDAKDNSGYIFHFKVSDEDEEKEPNFYYSKIKQRIHLYFDEIFKQESLRDKTHQVAAEFLQALADCGLEKSQLKISTELKNQLPKDFIIRMQVYSCKISEHSKDDIEIIVPKKTREIDIFLRRIKSGTEIFVQVSQDFPKSFVEFDKENQMILLRFDDLQRFINKIPSFSIKQCFSQPRLSLNLEGSGMKIKSSLKSSSWSPTVESDFEEKPTPRQRSKTISSESLGKKGKAIWEFFKGKFSSKSETSSSDEEQAEYASTNSSS